MRLFLVALLIAISYAQTEECPDANMILSEGDSCANVANGLTCYFGHECCCDRCYPEGKVICLHGTWTLVYHIDACVKHDCDCPDENAGNFIQRSKYDRVLAEEDGWRFEIAEYTDNAINPHQDGLWNKGIAEGFAEYTFLGSGVLSYTVQNSHSVDDNEEPVVRVLTNDDVQSALKSGEIFSGEFVFTNGDTIKFWERYSVAAVRRFSIQCGTGSGANAPSEIPTASPSIFPSSYVEIPSNEPSEIPTSIFPSSNPSMFQSNPTQRPTFLTNSPTVQATGKNVESTILPMVNTEATDVATDPIMAPTSAPVYKDTTSVVQATNVWEKVPTEVIIAAIFLILCVALLCIGFTSAYDSINCIKSIELPTKVTINEPPTPSYDVLDLSIGGSAELNLSDTWSISSTSFAVCTPNDAFSSLLDHDCLSASEDGVHLSDFWSGSEGLYSPEGNGTTVIIRNSGPVSNSVLKTSPQRNTEDNLF